MQAGDLMSRPVVTVRDFDSIKKAAGILAEHGFTSLPVVDADSRLLVGIVTEADLIRDAIPPDPRSDTRHETGHRSPVPSAPPPTLVSQIMTRSVHTAGPRTDCAEIAATMLEHNLRSVPVTEDRVVVGIVTRRDLMRDLARDDVLIQIDVRRNLDRYGGFEDWQVSVCDGRVVLTGPVGDPPARDVARALALATPGTRQVEVAAPRPCA
ncbi:BON domain-containing protein [Saccharopolyspora erythraea NRRL 2338]|nr:BON domain-containing protein [Saccharopolyspora erythraea NRRL 2338]